MDATDLHFQATADRGEFEMWLRRADGFDDAESDLGYVLARLSSLYSDHSVRDDSRVPSIELGPSQESLNVIAVTSHTITIVSRGGWSTVRDLNPRMSALQADALPDLANGA